MADHREYDETPDFNQSAKYVLGPDGKFYHEVDEFLGEYSFYFSSATKASALGATIPTGKKFHLRNLTVCNLNTVASQCVLKNLSAAGPTKLRIQVASSNTKDLSLKGYVFETAIYISFDTFATGTSVSLGGVLDPEES